MFYEQQSDVRGNCSIGLIHATYHIKTQTSIGFNTGMIMIDLKKAFCDTVDHSIICDTVDHSIICDTVDHSIVCDTVDHSIVCDTVDHSIICHKL